MTNTTTLQTVPAPAQSQAFSLMPRSFEQALQFAELIAKSDLAPKDYKGKPANVLVAVAMGAEVGLSPMQAVQNIAVINGRPSLWGDALLAVCQAHHSFVDIVETWDEKTNTASCTVMRRGRKQITRTFSFDDARRARLLGKDGPWTTYPQRMAQMRARGFACRDMFADVLRGIGSAEENADIPQEPEKNVTPLVSMLRNEPAPARTTAPAKVIEAEPTHDVEVDDLIFDIRAACTTGELRALVDRAGKLDNVRRTLVREVYRARFAELQEAEAQFAEMDAADEPAPVEQHAQSQPEPVAAPAPRAAASTKPSAADALAAKLRKPATREPGEDG